MTDDDVSTLVTAADLVEKLSFVMDEGDMREASRALEELSDDARYYGSNTWVEPEAAPRQVIRLVIKAAVRHMKNYEGYTTSRAGDETVTWDKPIGDAVFKADEKKRLAELAGRYHASVRTVGLYAFTNREASRFDRRDFVSCGEGQRPMLLGDPERPWA